MSPSTSKISRHGNICNLGASLWFLLSLTLASNSSADSLQDPDSVVRRTTLVVHDMEASIRFYRDILGFEVWLDRPGTTGPYSLPTDAPEGSPSRIVIMKGAHPWVAMVGLLQYGPARTLPPAPDKLEPGDSILMIETDQLQRIFERMQQAGTPILRPPVTTDVTGAGGAQWQATFLFAWDPDGHLLEINERSPATSPPETRVSRHYAPYRYGQLHYRHARPLRGAAGARPVVLLHQTPASGDQFEALLPLLAQQGREVYAIDTPGYGESDPPPEPLDIAGYAAALNDFIKTLPGPVDVLGYHTGVLLALELAKTSPDHIGKLVLVSVPLLTKEQRAAYKPNRDPIADDGSHLQRMWEQSMRVRADGQDKVRIARIVAEKQRAGEKSWWAGPAIFGYDTQRVLPKIRQPVLIIRPNDSLWENSGAAHELLPDSQMVEFSSWVYGFFDTEPERVAATVIPFLDE